MLLECDSCGAPLDVKENASVVRCAYCGRSASIVQYRRVAPETPRDFVPPREWTPPAHLPMESRPLRYRPRRRGTGFGAGTAIALMGFGGYLTYRVMAPTQQGAPPSSQAATLVGQALSAVNGAIDLAKARQAAASGEKVPILCSGTDTVQIMGKTLALENGVTIVAQGSCTVRLVGCAVRGTTAITAGGNAKVVVEGGSLEGKASAVVLFGNADLQISGGARLSGPVGILAAGNAVAHVRGSTIDATTFAVQASGNATVDTAGSVMHGKVQGTKRSH